MTNVNPARLAARRLSKLRDRRNILNIQRGRGGVVGEIGVWKGEFSTSILRIMRPRKLHLIDPWAFESKYPSRMYGGGKAKNQGDMDRIALSVYKRFKDTPNVIIHREPSSVALPKFNDSYFDWIYIDGNHSYEFVLADLRMCMTVTRSGGVIAGDDLMWRRREGYPVRRAVSDFCAENDLEKNITVVGDQFLIHLP